MWFVGSTNINNDKPPSYHIILLTFPRDGAEVGNVNHYVFNIT